MNTLGWIVLWGLVIALWLYIILNWGEKKMTPNRATILVLTALLLTVCTAAVQHHATTPAEPAKSTVATTDSDADDEDPDEYADSDDEEEDATDESDDYDTTDTDESSDDTTDTDSDTTDTTDTTTEESAVSSSAPAASSSRPVARSSSRTTTRYSTTRGTTHNPARAGSNTGTRHYAYKPVPKTGDSQIVYVSANIPGRYHKDPHCRGLEQRGGRVAMTLAQARAKGYVAFCAYERYE